jgi:hypothetical protein
MTIPTTTLRINPRAAKESLMKKVKLPGTIALLAIIVFGMAGCSLTGLFGYGVSLVIKNESSVTVRVEVMEGGGLKNWSGSLPPGASETRKGHFNSWINPAWDLRYTVGGKIGTKYGSYYGADHVGTCTITQADVDGL